MAEQSEESMTSRRLLLQAGALTVGVSLLGARGTANAGVAAPGGGADGTGAGADGAPPPPGTPLNRLSAAAAAVPSAPTSYNGWTVGTPGSVIGIANYTVPLTTVVLPIRSGDVATVLAYVARRFNAEVEPLLKGQCFGYDYRANVNNPSVWSNHASGTAIDLNSAKHPNGAPATFTAAKIAAVRRILAFCGDVVYWGQDYRGVVDGMHFEIDVPPGSSKLSRLAAIIRSSWAPQGHVDSIAYVGSSNVRVTGWAFDRDERTTEIPVAIYADGRGIGWFPTGLARPDVNAAFGLTGRHGYDASFPLSAGSHDIIVFAINAPGGDNPIIGGGTVQVGTKPIGRVDEVTPIAGGMRLRGWAFDGDDPAAELSVAVYVDGRGIDWFDTGRARPDINQVFGVPGNHGFDFPVGAVPGTHRVDVYAINVLGGSGNPLIGSQEITV